MFQNVASFFSWSFIVVSVGLAEKVAENPVTHLLCSSYIRVSIVWNQINKRERTKRRKKRIYTEFFTSMVIHVTKERERGVWQRPFLSIKSAGTVDGDRCCLHRFLQRDSALLLRPRAYSVFAKEMEFCIFYGDAEGALLLCRVSTVSNYWWRIDTRLKVMIFGASSSSSRCRCARAGRLSVPPVGFHS